MQQIGRAKQDGQDLINLINRETKLEDLDTVTSISFNQNIFFKDVSFKYQNAAKEVLSQANFKVNSNQFTAIVGEKGCGKSTILKLLYRVYDPTRGYISYGNYKSLKTFKIKEFRNGVAYVESQPTMIMGSVLENLLVDNSQVTEQELGKAIEMANAGFVYKLDDQLHTQIGQFDNSRTILKKCQKQRIAIARALLCKPKVLLIDDVM